MSFTRKSIADHLDAYDDEISELQGGKRAMLQDYRDQLTRQGMGKAQIKAEIEALKVAMRRRRAIAKKGKDEVVEADELAAEIFADITRAPRATRVASTVPNDTIPPHDEETGEILSETDIGGDAQDKSFQEHTERSILNTAPTESAGREISAPSTESDGSGTHVVLTSLATRGADESVATNSPETANDIHERPSINDEASTEAGLQAEASHAGTGSVTLADRDGRSEGEAATACLPTNPQTPAAPTSQRQAAPECSEPPPSSGATKQGCLDPDGCKLHFTSALCWRCNDARMKVAAV